jgi:hypothetical protein
MSWAIHVGAITGHVAVASELATHGAAHGGVVCGEAGVVDYHINSCLWVNYMLLSVKRFLWKVKSAPSSAARARRAPCLDVCERGVWVCLVLWV